MPQAISGSGGGLGCANSSTGDRCTNTAHLTEDEFRHDMTDYQVTAVQVRNNNGQLQLWISPDLTTATQSLVLHVGSESFAFEDADTKGAGNRRWNSSGLSWSVSDTIELKLTEGAGPPTEVPADWSLIPAALSSERPPSGSSSSPRPSATAPPPTSRPTTPSSRTAPRPATPTSRPTATASESSVAPQPSTPATTPGLPTPAPTRASRSTGSAGTRSPTTTRISTTGTGTMRPTTRTS